MNKKTPELTRKDVKIVEIFSDLGMPKNLAKTLMYISQCQECRSADIEYGARLRQPEVSVAMHHLEEKGWITKRDQKKEGKGRPIYIYKLTSPIDNIIETFEKEKLQEIESVKKDIKELKSLINDR
ncbi:MAG: ArsR family transcriptional regulator [Candidatus Thermoplasmatota archaeon]|nr:ArsR family transcriptional regulator [Candidatus Thermoplasmatota archaeon]MCK5301174.1 ArsR family transcriptional regulator [Thermoplasmatales archaeon]